MKITVFTKGRDALEHVDALIEALREKGCIILDYAIMFLSESQCDNHYAHIVGKSFYGAVREMFSVCPSFFLLIEGELNDVMAVVGEVTDPSECAPGTFRNMYGKDKTHNGYHRSDEEGAPGDYSRFWGKDGYITEFRKDPLAAYEVVMFLLNMGSDDTHGK